MQISASSLLKRNADGRRHGMPISRPPRDFIALGDFVRDARQRTPDRHGIEDDSGSGMEAVEG